MKRYWKYIKPYLPAFILGPILMIVEVLGEIVMPKLMANIIDRGVAGRNYTYMLIYGVAMVVVALLMMAGGVGGAWFAAKACVSFTSDLRKDVFDKVQLMSFANLDKFSTGSLVTRLTNDTIQVQNLINTMMRMMLRAPGMLIGAVIMAVILNPQLALVLFVIIPILVVVLVLVIRYAFPMFGIMQEKLDKLNTNVQEVLTSMRVIKSFVREDYEKVRFADSNRNLKEASLGAFKVMILLMPIMAILMNATTLAVVWFGGNEIIVGKMEVGNLTAFITYVTQILMSLMMLAFMLLQSSRALASLGRIKEVLDAEIDIDDKDAKEPTKEVKLGSIEFKNVSFKYYKNSDEKVLNNISIKIEGGSTVGIIGSTGSGKTTLVSMIPRLYDVDEGTVLVDGCDVKDYSLHNLREGVGMVLQKNVLFSGTVKENLKWGDENALDEAVVSFAKMAQADGFVSEMPEGYDSEIEQGGSNVSGGQKQRLCIARALLKMPKILILDDSTSAVDTATERKIRECFYGSLKDTTKIIIAQRISSVIDADRIFVMDDGEIVGCGTHDELIKSNATYQEIYYSQMDKNEEVGA